LYISVTETENAEDVLLGPLLIIVYFVKWRPSKIGSPIICNRTACVVRRPALKGKLGKQAIF